HVINLIQTDGWRKGIEIRKRKKDVINSVLIVDLIRYGSFEDTTLANEEKFSIRQLTRYRLYLVRNHWGFQTHNHRHPGSSFFQSTIQYFQKLACLKNHPKQYSLNIQLQMHLTKLLLIRYTETLRLASR